MNLTAMGSGTVLCRFEAVWAAESGQEDHEFLGCRLCGRVEMGSAFWNGRLYTPLEGLDEESLGFVDDAAEATSQMTEYAARTH
jgi:hypothetical protein